MQKPCKSKPMPSILVICIWENYRQVEKLSLKQTHIHCLFTISNLSILCLYKIYITLLPFLPFHTWRFHTWNCLERELLRTSEEICSWDKYELWERLLYQLGLKHGMSHLQVPVLLPTLTHITLGMLSCKRWLGLWAGGGLWCLNIWYLSQYRSNGLPVGGWLKYF